MILKSAARAAAISTAILAGMVTAPGQASADTTGPVVSEIGKIRTDTGLELTADIDAPAGVTSVTATITAGTANVPDTFVSTVTDFHLVSGTATSGAWQSSGALGLDIYAGYRVAITAQDSQGTVSLPGRGMLDYRPTPVFHDTAYEPTALSFEHQDINVTGRLTEYDPASGDTGTPWQTTAATGVFVTWDGHTSPRNATAADGTFAFTVHPGDVQNTTLHVFVPATTTYAQGPDSEPITSVDSPVRITLDHTGSTGALVGSTQVISGTAERQQEDGTWVPLANIPLPIQDNTGTRATWATTDATGRFSQTVTVTNDTTIWTVSDTRPFLTPTSVSYTVANPVAKVSLYANKPAVDAYSRLHISGYLTVPGVWWPSGGRVYIQQSNDGHTGWTSIGSTTIDTSDNGFAASVLTVTNPHGYWRYYYPGAPGFTAAYSPVVHAFRYQTAISGGKPSSTRVAKGHTVTISGTLKQNGYGYWTPLPKATVQIFFRPSGSSTWHLITSAHTSSTGYFAAHPTITRSGTWRVVYKTPDQVHVNAYGPMVRVTAI
ncbi:hypothetical protein ABZ904_37805 [Streptomyces sp. NPDC046900]|uniref:hypothetical protein n=1 Tax=Streptomyces sp. NPDC046900 TaxID=3155473 RepID=UPI0033C75AA6